MFKCHFRKLVAKTDPQNQDRYLPLWMHAKDTAGVMAYLCENWLPHSMETLMGVSRPELHRLLIFLASIHDVGKISNSFIHQISMCFPEVLTLMEPLHIHEPEKDDAKYRHHTIVGAAILNHLGAPDWLVSIVGAHHGKTLDLLDLDLVMASSNLYAVPSEREAWQTLWQECLTQALAQADYASLADLPNTISQPAQLLLTALLIVADWLASNTSLFPLIGLDQTVTDAAYPQRVQHALQHAEKQHLAFTRWEPGDTWQYTDLCTERFGYPAANPTQRTMTQIAEQTEHPGLFILEAPMGIGKTEAALMAGEILASRLNQNGLAFFLPSQATTNAMFGRMIPWIRSFSDKEQSWLDDDATSGNNGQLAVSLAHGKAMMNELFSELAESSTNADGSDRIITNAFFMGRKTKLLANFIVGTVDQLLMGALNQKHLMLRHLGLATKVVVVDEIHAYDAYMTRYMKGMLNWLGAYGAPVILLSATLPGERRAELVSAYLGKDDLPEKSALENERAYPLLTWTDGDQVHTQALPLDSRQTPVQILRGQDTDLITFLRDRLQNGGCAGIIVNTVNRAQTIAEQLVHAFPHCKIILDHAQYLMPDRIACERQLMTCLGKASTRDQRDGLIVVGTQVLEQSLDIDFDVLVSDLCPMDLLLQRLGRLHRHQRADRPIPSASCLVLNADGETLEAGAEAIYGEYLLKKTSSLLPGTILLPEDISPLVQETYHAQVSGTDPSYNDYRNQCDAKDHTADQTCIPNAKRIAGRRRTTRVIDGLMNHQIDQSEAQAQSSVRDGVASIEVLVLQYGHDGLLHLASQMNETFSVDARVLPSLEEAKVIMQQSLRLPYIFSLPGMINQVIDELESIRQSILREWTQSPSIGRELFLLLDANGCATLAGKHVVYDTLHGFRVEKEVSNDRESV